ncbi:hypothetical protein HF086_015283 [Spodoptera exigua]|uniref:FP protein C-terminal domain-containing protein n=1 Tax=Spodoptera exigua TaxID=7107 RepID=A0A922M8W6_SPOEX|nr:hypothetical protein HF086_015283 [Spodoptera exigua]
MSDSDIPKALHSDDNVNTQSRHKRPRCDLSPSKTLEEHNLELKSMLRTWKQEQEEHMQRLVEQQTSALETVVAEIKVLKTQNSSIQNINQEIRDSIDFMNSKFEEMRQQMDNLKRENQAYKISIANLERKVEDLQVRSHTSDNDLTDKLSGMELKIESLEQQARLNNIEICNLPERRDEDLLELVEKIGATIKCLIPRQEVLAVHRVPHARAMENNKPKNIVVKLASRTLRDNVLSAYRLCKNVTSDLIGMSGTPHKMYLNEHLTLYNKQLFRTCREVARKYNVKYVWIRNATILVKATDGSKTFAVRCQSDVNKIAQCYRQNE